MASSWMFRALGRKLKLEGVGVHAFKGTFYTIRTRLSKFMFDGYTARAVESPIIGEGFDIHIFGFCTINFFLNQLFLWCVNTNM